MLRINSVGFLLLAVELLVLCNGKRIFFVGSGNTNITSANTNAMFGEIQWDSTGFGTYSIPPAVANQPNASFGLYDIEWAAARSKLYYMAISARHGHFSEWIYESGIRRSPPASTAYEQIYMTPPDSKMNTQSFSIDATNGFIYISDYDRFNNNGYLRGYLRRTGIDGGPVTEIASVSFPSSLTFGDPAAQGLPFTAMMEQVVYQDRIYFTDVKKPGLNSIGIDGLGRVMLWDGTTTDGYFWSAYFFVLAPQVSKIFFNVLPINTSIPDAPDSNIYWIPLTGGEATRIPAGGEVDCITIDNDNNLLVVAVNSGTSTSIKLFDFDGNGQTLMTLTAAESAALGLLDSMVVEPGPLPGAAPPAVSAVMRSSAMSGLLLAFSAVVAMFVMI